MTDDGRDGVGLKALEGYFDNLAAATNKKTVLEQLFASNANLIATNEELVAVIKYLTNGNKDLQQETNRLNKRAAADQHKGIGTQHCAAIAGRKAITILMPVLSWKRTRKSARPVGKLVVTVWDCQQE